MDAIRPRTATARIPHIHRHHTDLFYVLAGELTIGLGADRQETAVPAGRSWSRRRSSSTRSGTRADEELRYLNFHAPGGGFADYLRGVTPGFDSEDPPADGGRPVEDALIVPAEAGPLLVDRDEIRIEVRDAPGPASNRLTCLFALEDGGSSRSARRLATIEARWPRVPGRQRAPGRRSRPPAPPRVARGAPAGGPYRRTVPPA